MDRELTYQVPYERLTKVGRSLRRQAFPAAWTRLWLVLGAFLVGLVLLTVFGKPLDRWQESVGLPRLSAFVLWLVAFLIAVLFVRRTNRHDLKGRADFDASVRLRQEDGGLRIMGDQIEYYVKWNGISQLLKPHDGVALAHAALIFFVPDSAFINEAERNGFVRDVFARMGAEAQRRSQKNIASLLQQTGQA